MKAALVLLVACIIVVARGEVCTTGADTATIARECGHMACTANWHLTCDNKVCTCVENSPDNTACSTKAECDAIVNWNCDARRRHCIDMRCRCFRH